MVPRHCSCTSCFGEISQTAENRRRKETDYEIWICIFVVFWWDQHLKCLLTADAFLKWHANVWCSYIKCSNHQNSSQWQQQNNRKIKQWQFEVFGFIQCGTVILTWFLQRCCFFSFRITRLGTDRHLQKNSSAIELFCTTISCGCEIIPKKRPRVAFSTEWFWHSEEKHLWPVVILERKVFFSSCDSSTRCLGTLMLLFLMLYEEHQAATKPGRDPVQRNSSRPCCQSGSCRGGLFTSPSSLPAEATLSSSLLQGSLLTRAGMCGRPAGWPDINVLPFSIEKKKKPVQWPWQRLWCKTPRSFHNVRSFELSVALLWCCVNFFMCCPTGENC